MDYRSFEISESPKIILNVSGNVSVKGWDKLEVSAKSSSPDDLALEVQDGQVNITCQSNCTLRIPYDSLVEAEDLSGDGVFKAIEGEISIQQIAGSLTLRSVGEVTLGIVNGNLAAKNVDGSLNLDACDGNVAVRDIRGDFQVRKNVLGNLSLKEIDGDAKAQANGNVTVELDPSPESMYDFQAKGNLTCRVPSDVSARINILAGAKVRVKIPDVDIPAQIDTPFELFLGEGASSLTLSAAGIVTLTTRPPDWDMGAFEVGVGTEYEHLAETLEEEISAQIEAQMELMEEELQIQLDNITASINMSGLDPDVAEGVAERTRRATERANQRAQEKMRQAQEKMNRKLEAARRRAERKARAAERAARDRRRRPDPATWATPPTRPVSEPVSDEERLMILQLLEQGKVTTEEAEQLLAALEGKSP